MHCRNNNLAVIVGFMTDGAPLDTRIVYNEKKKSMVEPWINTFKSDIDLDPYPSGGACFAFACVSKVRHHYRYEMDSKTIKIKIKIMVVMAHNGWILVVGPG